MTRVTLDELMAETGLGPRSARRLVREGNLPGLVTGSQYVCSRGEFQKWLDGEWKYTGVKSTEPATKKRKPVSIVRLNEKVPA